MAEPLHPVIQLDKGAKICEPLDTPDIDLSFLNIIQVAARAHAKYGYVIWILHTFTGIDTFGARCGTPVINHAPVVLIILWKLLFISFMESIRTD